MVERPPSEKSIFLEALAIEAAEARASYLDAACGADRGLRDAVESLLRAHDRPQQLLDAPGALAPTAVWGPEAVCTGTAVGPYKLRDVIGEGGMGTVYMAEQTEPVRRRVALKVIKPGMDSKQVLARFEAERQALAMMDHPNIAHVLDGGMTPSDRPYFVMELVRGLPITDYCDQHQLSIRDRLELFVLVCRAVQHAHQKGVIHRDLKPSNVLVTVVDGVAVPKVIDFGIAKATGAALTDRTLFTGFHQLLGTPLYMSPEQAGQSGADVDTRSDIYSLGVLLYELLTGTTPFDPETLKGAAIDEMRRIIREDCPVRPSTRLSTLGDRLSTVSARRRVDSRRLGASLKGELDWVVMKSLEKDRRRRYETASDFAADVLRYLSDLPVEAGPPSARYRLMKFARRHRGVLASVLAVAAALSVGTALSVRQAVRATAAEGRATKALEAARVDRRLAVDRYEFARRAVDEMYTEFADRILSKLERPTPVQRDFLLKALDFYRRFASEPGQGPDDRHKALLASVRVAQIHLRLGQLGEAEAAGRDAVELARRLARERPDRDEARRELSEVLVMQGEPLGRMGRLGEAEASLREGLSIQEAMAEETDSVKDRLILARHRCVLVEFLAKSGRLLDAEPISRLALATFEELAPEHAGDPLFIDTLAGGICALTSHLALTLRHEEAERLIRRGVDVVEQARASDPEARGLRFQLFCLLMNLTAVLHIGDRLAEGDEVSLHALGIIEELVADYPATTFYRFRMAEHLYNRANLLDDLGREADADAAFGRTRDHFARMIQDQPDNSEYRDRLADLERKRRFGRGASRGFRFLEALTGSPPESANQTPPCAGCPPD